ncbi:MAG TPA: pyridoxamine 5'-phosphate oxidase [Thermoanaerobaculia bacterium]|nr:pyridoxamine 5'-phosphate oxidase [Thermoanaerobaculia bacterium]
MTSTSPNPDPLARFREVFAAAEAAGSNEVDRTAMTLATADRAGHPSARIVLLKGVDERGFVFYTNYDSRKARELEENPFAALCLFWPSLDQQVRVEGRIERVTGEESDAYFAQRPRESQLGAWASRQSETLTSRQELLTRLHDVEKRFAGAAVIRPSFWGGYLLRPEWMEFWQRGDFRLHHRTAYIKDDDEWRIEELYP